MELNRLLVFGPKKNTPIFFPFSDEFFFCFVFGRRRDRRKKKRVESQRHQSARPVIIFYRNFK